MAKNKKIKRRIKKPALRQVIHHLPPARHQPVRNAISASNSLIAQGKYGDALALCKQLVEIEPQNAEIALTMATAYEHAGDIALGEQAYQKAFKLAPNFPPAMVNYALMYHRAGMLEKALSGFQAALALEADFIPALDGVSRTLFDLRRYQLAVPAFEKLARLRGTSVDLMELARVQELAGNVKAALATCQRSLILKHDNASIEILAGMFSLSHGNKTTATKHFEKAIQKNQDAGFAYFHLAKTDGNLARLPEIDAAIARTTEKSVANIQAPLLFAKGYLLEKSGNYELAFQSFKRANELVSSVKPNDNEQRQHLFAQAQSTFTREFIADLHQNKTDQSKRPVFVTGLPRSGTTLVEQIIAGHKDAFGLGEVELIPLLLPAMADTDPQSFLSAAKTYRTMYPPELAGSKRMVDKSISSLLHLGTIVSMFPNAKIICCERHPMDVAWSAFKQYFNDGALAYTYSFERLAEHQKLYAKAAEHWQNIFPESILKVRYEDLVTSPEHSAKQLISHVSLDWQDSCLNFHKNQTPVRTASYDQVRQPVYTSSIGSWKPYETWLEPLKSLLNTEIINYNRN